MKKPHFALNNNARSMSGAALSFGLGKKGLSRSLTAVLVLVLLTQVFFIGPVRQAKASPRLPLAVAPVSAPPEPFLQYGRVTANPLAVILGSQLVTSVRSFFDTPKQPAGLQLAKGPSISERISGSAASLLGFFVPAKNTASSLTGPAPMPTPPHTNITYDFDGDGYADIGRWHGETYEFKVREGQEDFVFTTYTLGSSSSAKSAPGDFNGDGLTDPAVFNSGTWTYKISPNPSGTPQTMSHGASGDIPVVGNYDTDAADEFAVYRPSDHTWYIKKTSGTLLSNHVQGVTGDIPVPGDYDGDGTTDFALFRPSDGKWYIDKSSGGSISPTLGSAADVPVQGDFDGDGKSDPAVYRPSDGTWYVKKSSDSYTTLIQKIWGNYNDQPVAADYDGDGKTDFAVWRPTNGMWLICNSGYNPMVSGSPPFSYYLFGTAGDTAVPSSYTKQIGGVVVGGEEDLAKARLMPRNATGGTNVFSQNFSWSTPLVNLPGRSGLNAGFGMSYNSLVWVKNGSAMYFDPDKSNISPGFRFGFPVIEPVYYDKDKNIWQYLIVAPGGGRVEFRQIGASATYETANSTYTQLVTSGASNPNDPVEDIHIKITTTDGTQMSYEWSAGAFRCTKILDRNGNYITVQYDSLGLLATVRDTLGREIHVTYDSSLYPTAITQTWKGTNGSGTDTTHTWASFSYTTTEMDTDFEGVGVVGPPNNTNIKVLDKVTYANGSSTKFEYNDYIQVKKISTIAADASPLNYVETDLATPDAGQIDCPRFIETRTQAENFNGGAPVVVRNVEPTSFAYTAPDAEEMETLRVKVYVVGHPDDLYTNIYFGSESWREGLPIATEDCLGTDTDCSTQKRWTWTKWEQDMYGGEYAPYPINPRTIETRVGDGTNMKRTTTTYYMPTEPIEGEYFTYWGLVKDVYVYDGLSTSPEKHSYNEYDLSTAFVTRRIIGLPSMTKLYGREASSLPLVSKITYAYDENGYTGTGQSVSSATQHDDTNYGTAFSYRGNLTSTKRWDVRSGYESNSSEAVSSSVAYNILGSPISKTDPVGRVTRIGYTDSFNSTVGVSTYAYPTVVTDPAGTSLGASGHTSNIQYRYDIGANVEAVSPASAGNYYGKKTKRVFDSAGRLERDSIVVNTTETAYTRYEYPTNGVQLKSYSPVVDADGDGNIAEDEVLKESLMDGAGRVRKSRTEHPGSTGGYMGKLVEYDFLGQVTRESVPTEINSSWNPAGDDDRGMSGSDYVWLWGTTKEYDWKGRVTRTYPSDSNGTDGKDTLISYAGCGCAGGVETTIEGPVVPRDDTSGTARRKQKIFDDILGRTVATQAFEWNGSTVYTTTTNAYNGRDQVTETVQYAGTASSVNTHQVTTTFYDGHGRVDKMHKPEFFDSNGSTYITNTYNDDDTVATMEDPRGAVTTYTYGDPEVSEKPALVTKIEYEPPSSSPSYPALFHIPDVTDVTFTYDNLGNRLTMTDGTGTRTYAYDELSRMTSETTVFLDTLDKAPPGGYVLSYEYHLSGALKSIEDPFEHKTTYAADKVGRMTKIGAAGRSDPVINDHVYASDIEYRAFGAVKGMSLSTTDATNISMTYDNALRPETYDADNSTDTTPVQRAAYTYSNDGMVNAIDNIRDGGFDQTNKHDFAGRLTGNTVGPSGSTFRQTMVYDAFNNLTVRETHTYSLTPSNFTATYTNNRKSSESYDSAGNVIASSSGSGLLDSSTGWYNDSKTWYFDAAGRMARWEEQGPWGSTTKRGGETTYDGDGHPVKTAELQSELAGGVWSPWSNINWYHLFSSVTGQKISDLILDGSDSEGILVYMGDSVIYDTTYQGPFQNEGAYTAIGFKTTDPVSGSTQEMDSDGAVPTPTVNPNARNEQAGLGMSVPATDPGSIYQPDYDRGGWGGQAESGCTDPDLDQPMPCNLLALMMNANYPFQDLERRRKSIGFNGPSSGTGADGRPMGFDPLQGYHGVMYFRGSGEKGEWRPINSGSGGGRGNTQTTNAGGGAKISPRCKDQVSLLVGWDEVEELLKNPPLMDIEGTPSLFDVSVGSIASDKGSNYFGTYSRPGESASSTFDRYAESSGAWTVRGSGVVEGIYYRGSRGTNLVGNFLLHEVLHLLFPRNLQGDMDLDTALIHDLNIKKGPRMSDSDAVSRFFNSGCDRKYGGIK